MQVQRAVGRWLRIARHARAAEEAAFHPEYAESVRLAQARRAVDPFICWWADRARA